MTKEKALEIYVLREMYEESVRRNYDGYGNTRVEDKVAEAYLDRAIEEFDNDAEYSQEEMAIREYHKRAIERLREEHNKASNQRANERLNRMTRKHKALEEIEKAGIDIQGLELNVKEVS